MPRTTYEIDSEAINPPVAHQELELFTFAMQASETRECLRMLGKEVPPRFSLTHNTDGSDPPDLVALGLGWEITYFPPNQIPMQVAHRKRSGAHVRRNFITNIPPFHQTGDSVKKIASLMTPISLVRPEAFAVEDEIAALEKHFSGVVLKKDLFGNDILLLDQRREVSEYPWEAIRRSLRKKPLKFFKAVILVGTARHRHGDRRPRPDVFCYLR